MMLNLSSVSSSHVAHVSPGHGTLHLVDPGIQLHQQE